MVTVKAAVNVTHAEAPCTMFEPLVLLQSITRTSDSSNDSHRTLSSAGDRWIRNIRNVILIRTDTSQVWVHVIGLYSCVLWSAQNTVGGFNTCHVIIMF